MFPMLKNKLSSLQNPASYPHFRNAKDAAADAAVPSRRTVTATGYFNHASLLVKASGRDGCQCSTGGRCSLTTLLKRFR